MKLHSTAFPCGMCRSVPVFAALVLGACVVARGESSGSLALVVDRIREAGIILEKNRQIADAEKNTDAMLETWLGLVDSRALYRTTEDMQSWLAAEDGAIFDAGLRLANTNNLIVISEIAPDSNARAAGLQVGDRLLAVDRAPTSGETVERVQSWLQLSTKRALILTVADASGHERDVSLDPIPGRRPAVAFAETLPTGLAYLKLNGFYPQSEGEILSTIRRWVGTPNCYGLILDIRGAGGRDAEAAAAVAAIFAAEGRVLAAFQDVDGRETAAFRAGPGFPVTFPVMILTDADTRGAAEWFAAVAKGLGRGAMLIGFTTRGDPLIREPMPLSWHRSLYVVTRRLVTADGTVYAGKEGVVPHILVSVPEEHIFEPALRPDAMAKMSDQEKEDRRLRIRVGSDAVLRRAVELLLGLRALNVKP